ncbi:hypothetical protein [Gordonia sp. ABSL49_1]|uniref:hypothetical protein n=1 Tax=Gordonia sp. ABSL49_1 TaxID=2920941 RepID=UPI001F0D2D83|nr:hypothetical protein [Gordonia sp. ABSL49_1]MCH5644151.1 hypothetical protein [Gordonia sp. ABSL49_1]
MIDRDGRRLTGGGKPDETEDQQCRDAELVERVFNGEHDIEIQHHRRRAWAT